jgi:hypothetical protein
MHELADTCATKKTRKHQEKKKKGPGASTDIRLGDVVAAVGRDGDYLGGR